MSKLTDKKLCAIADNAIRDYTGNTQKLKAAIGMLHMGRLVGWKVILLMHDKKALRQYEKILDIDIREVFPEDGELQHKSIAWKASQKITNFWKAVSGDIPGIKSPDLE